MILLQIRSDLNSREDRIAYFRKGGTGFVIATTNGPVRVAWSARGLNERKSAMRVILMRVILTCRAMIGGELQ
jgi:hypothetical protein